MMPWDKSTNPRGGILDSHLESANREIQDKLGKKAEKAAKKISKIETDKNIKAELENNRAKLDSAIQDLIEKGQ